MKCINKWLSVALIVSLTCLTLSGCSKEEDVDIKAAYDVYETSTKYGLTNVEVAASIQPFAKDICVIGFDDTVVDDSVHDYVAQAAGVFLTDSKEATYTQKIHQKMYPASTTKILTAYVALKYGDLDEYVTVTESALDGLASDSSFAGIQVGDTLSMEQLLYGLMLASGNDAAAVIAETISGSEEEFAKLMTEEALALGATDSNFKNAHGLPDKEHYTSVYDLYLIFNAAIQNEKFVEIISDSSYTAVYTNKAGETVSKTWNNTNRYLTGEYDQPKGVTVIGGKTGTTFDAGYCLVLLSENEAEEPVISIVLKADARSNLYLLMGEILSKFSN